MTQALLPANYVKALEVKRLAGVNLPLLDGWTKDPDKQILPFQQKGISYLYVARKALLADPVGLGKTIQALGLIMLLRHRGEPFRTTLPSS